MTEWLGKGLVSAGSDALFCLDFQHAILNGCSHVDVVKTLSWARALLPQLCSTFAEKDLRPGMLNFFWPKVLQIPRHKAWRAQMQQSSTAVYPFCESSFPQVDQKRSASLCILLASAFHRTLVQTAKGAF